MHTCTNCARVAVFSTKNCLRRVHWIRLLSVEEYRLPITNTDVVLSTPHDSNGTFEGGYSAKFTASRRVLKGARRDSVPFKNSREHQCIALAGCNPECDQWWNTECMTSRSLGRITILSVWGTDHLPPTTAVKENVVLTLQVLCQVCH